jgi:ribonucleoside-diphosphate reductase beta chain
VQAPTRLDDEGVLMTAPPVDRGDRSNPRGFGSIRNGGLQWDKLPMRLFVQGNAKFWNPADIDFSRDAQDWHAMNDLQKDAMLSSATLFLAGEEAVTQDIQPFMAAMAAEGRLEDELYLTQFAFEEAKHVEVWRRWLDALGVSADLHDYIEENEGYRIFFYDKLPNALERLHHDHSPEAQVRAAVVYNQVIEGSLALTGYWLWQRICDITGRFPGMRELIRRIGDDERRHMAWGTYTCRRHVAADDAMWDVVQDSLNEMQTPLLLLINDRREQYEEESPFGIDPDESENYALDRFMRRFGAIESARGKSVASIEGGTTEIDLEEQFAEEDADQSAKDVASW